MAMRGSVLAVWGLAVVVVVVWPSSVAAGGESVLMKSIEVLTLYTGKMTKGRRSSAVPQLECVSGGTAPCDTFRPRVVQCYNRGWDGEDVQWECKTDMDNAYRFGNIEVSCEGYDYRDDPYVLRGSCGLRYTIDYTKEGYNQKHTHDYYGNNYNTKSNQKLSSQSYLADFIVVIAVCLMLWAFYKTCFAPRQTREDAWSTTGDDYPAGGGGGYGWFGQGGGTHPTAPPPPGAHYQSGYDNASCRNRASGGGTGGGGFWTGAVTGGLLGYMFGNRGGGRNYTYGGGGGGGGSGWSWGGGGGSGGHSFGGSTGTRAASGFGGTSRR